MVTSRSLAAQLGTRLHGSAALAFPRQRSHVRRLPCRAADSSSFDADTLKSRAQQASKFASARYACFSRRTRLASYSRSEVPWTRRLPYRHVMKGKILGISIQFLSKASVLATLWQPVIHTCPEIAGQRTLMRGCKMERGALQPP